MHTTNTKLPDDQQPVVALGVAEEWGLSEKDVDATTAAVEEHPLAAALLTQLEASERLDQAQTPGQVVDNRGSTHEQQINVVAHPGSTINIGGPSMQSAGQHAPAYEGPGGVPPLPVKDFAGRVAELDELGRKLADHETVCVVATGLGGVGKTSLAQQFVATRKATFPDGSAWLDARRLTEDLERVCRRFGWPGERAPAPEDAVRFLAGALHERSFLLVVDNVAEDLPLAHVPRSGGRCRTLVTSRARHIHIDLDAGLLELDVWSIEEALGYLRTRCERLRGCSDAELRPLVEFVGRLPLGVKLFAALLVRRSFAPAAALAKLRAQPVGLLEKHRGQNPGLVATFQSTYDDLDERSRRVLQAMAVCARRTRAAVVGPVSGIEDVDEVLDDLYARSLVEREDDQVWKLHDVVRLFMRAQPGADRLEAAQLEWVEAHLVVHADVLDHVAFSEGVDETQEALRRLVEVRDFERAMEVYIPLVEHLRRTGSYPRAMEVSQMLLHAVEPDSAWAAECLGNLGLCYRTLGDLPKAIDFLERSLAINEKLGRLEGQAKQLGNLGLCYRTLGDLPKGIDFLERALAINEKLGRLEGQAADIASLGLCYRILGDVPKGIDFLERALAINEKLGHLNGQAKQLGNLGLCYRTLGDAPKAIDFLERALAINEKLGRLEGQAINLGNLGAGYQTLGDVPKAIDFLERALAIDEKLGRLEGQASDLGDLGLCYLTLGDVPKAEDHLRRARAIVERMGLPATHPRIRLINEVLASMATKSSDASG